MQEYIFGKYNFPWMTSKQVKSLKFSFNAIFTEATEVTETKAADIIHEEHNQSVTFFIIWESDNWVAILVINYIKQMKSV